MNSLKSDLETVKTSHANEVKEITAALEKAVANRSRHRAIDYFLRNPFDLAEFDQRFMFGDDVMEGSLLKQYAATLNG